jgi:hypothetical protein
VSTQFTRKINAAHPGAEIAYSFTVMWSGWECDDEAAVIRQGGDAFLVTTDHGSLIRVDAEWLTAKISEYRSAISDTEKALAMLADNA